MNPIIVHNIWTLEYTHDLFHFVTVPPTITRERGIRYFDTEAGVCAEISRRIVCPIGRELGSIMFEVECTLAEFGNSRYFFIMIEEVEGAMSIVDVLRVYRPNPGYERTIKYRRICSTREALPRTNRELGTAHFLSREGLAKLLLEERDHFPGLYHSEDCENFGDIRALSGVVKWYPATYKKMRELPVNHFRFFLQADAIRVAAPFSEGSPGLGHGKCLLPQAHLSVDTVCASNCFMRRLNHFDGRLPVCW